jgi:hypothetical protein
MTRSMARSCGLRLVPPMIISSAAATAIQLLTLGIPCLYYGTEQGSLDLRSPNGCGCRAGEVTIAICVRRCSGRAFRVLQAGLAFRGSVPGTGLIMSSQGSGRSAQPGAHCFVPGFPLYLRTAAITAVRSEFPVVRSGRQYPRPVSVFGEPFGSARAGELFGQSYGLWCCVLGNPQCRPERGPVAGQPALN